MKETNWLDLELLSKLNQSLEGRNSSKVKSMTPKQKANELVDDFSAILKSISEYGNSVSIQCALICVYELIKSECEECGRHHNSSYWEKVKKEIELL